VEYLKGVRLGWFRPYILLIRLERPAKDKRSSLVCPFINYDCGKFNNIDLMAVGKVIKLFSSSKLLCRNKLECLSLV
jgi:hypothetical protein